MQTLNDEQIHAAFDAEEESLLARYRREGKLPAMLVVLHNTGWVHTIDIEALGGDVLQELEPGELVHACLNGLSMNPAIVGVMFMVEAWTLQSNGMPPELAERLAAAINEGAIKISQLPDDVKQEGLFTHRELATGETAVLRPIVRLPDGTPEVQPAEDMTPASADGDDPGWQAQGRCIGFFRRRQAHHAWAHNRAERLRRVAAA